MRACILAIGSEMLTPFRVDTNSLIITDRLNTIGYDVRLKAVVADDVDELARVLNGALAWADLIVVTGGLGPTEDDITRDAVARVFDMPLDVDERIVERIRDRFARRGMTMPEINRRQAMVPRGATVLANPNGTAPGLWLERDQTALVLLPGPPREMTPMLESVIRERLAPKTGGRGLFRRVLKITGRAESDVDARAQPVYSKWTAQSVPISTTILAVLGQIELHLTAQAASRIEADEALEAAVRELQNALGPAVYSTDGRPLEVVVGDLLRERKLTIAVAESCTGGLLTSRLTDVPGSSEYVERGAPVPVALRIADARGANRSAPGIEVTPQRVASAGGSMSIDLQGGFRFDPVLGGYRFLVETKDLSSGNCTLSFVISGDPIVHTVKFDIR